tara:strand:+ start:287 stop:2077 length:1791 start_codon:yes stop_codon:yes gene_type:complete
MKNIRIILISLSIIVGGGFYFWAQDYSQGKAAQQISIAEEKIISLVKSQLNEDITISYDFKNFVLISQTLNIENLLVKSSFAELKIPKLSISGNEDTLSIKNLEKLEIIEIGESNPLVEIDSLKLINLSIKNLLKSKNILDFSTNLKLEKIEVLNARFDNLSQEASPSEIAYFSVDNLNSGTLGNILLEGLVYQDSKNNPKISLKSASIANLNFGKLLRSRDILDFFNNLNFNNFKVVNARASNLGQGVTPAEISLFSIDSVNSGNVENILLQGLVIQENKNGPIASLESASIDKISDLLPLFESIEVGNSGAIASNVGNLLDLGSFEVNGIKVKDPTGNNLLNLDLFNIKLTRDNKLVNSMEIKLSGLEVDKFLLEDEYDLPAELLESFKEDKLKLNTAWSLNADYKISEITTNASLGFDKIGELSIEYSQGGFSRDLVNYALNNIDSIDSREFTNRVEQDTTFKSLNFSFFNEGLIDILLEEVQKNMNLTPDEMVQMVNQEIEKSREISSDVKKKLKQALTTLVKSRKGFEISLRTKDKDGVSYPKLVDSFINGLIWKSVELDIKGTIVTSQSTGQKKSQNEQDAPFKGLTPTF